MKKKTKRKIWIFILMMINITLLDICLHIENSIIQFFLLLLPIGMLITVYEKAFKDWINK